MGRYPPNIGDPHLEKIGKVGKGYKQVGKFPTGGGKGWGGVPTFEKFSFHFWMIQTMFKNKIKKMGKIFRNFQAPPPLVGNFPLSFFIFFEPFP